MQVPHLNLSTPFNRIHMASPADHLCSLNRLKTSAQLRLGCSCPKQLTQALPSCMFSSRIRKISSSLPTAFVLQADSSRLEHIGGD